jgi:hypothetical protein
LCKGRGRQSIPVPDRPNDGDDAQSRITRDAEGRRDRKHGPPPRRRRDVARTPAPVLELGALQKSGCRNMLATGAKGSVKRLDHVLRLTSGGTFGLRSGHRHSATDKPRVHRPATGYEPGVFACDAGRAPTTAGWLNGSSSTRRAKGGRSSGGAVMSGRGPPDRCRPAVLTTAPHGSDSVGLRGAAFSAIDPGRTLAHCEPAFSSERCSCSEWANGARYGNRNGEVV